MNLIPSFIDDFFFTSFQPKNEIKKGKYRNEIQIFTFLREQMNDLLTWRMYRFQKKFDRR